MKSRSSVVIPTLISTILFLVLTLCNQSAASRSTSLQSTARLTQSPDFCEYTEIPVTGEEPPYAHFSAQVFYIGRDFWGAIRFKNASPKPVASVRALMEYYDSNGQSVLSVTYAAGQLEPQASEESLPNQESSDMLKAPIPPGGTYYLSGINSLTTTRCPKHSQLRLVRIHYADGTDIRWSTENWASNAVLRDSPMFSNLPCDHLKPGFSTHLQLQIGSNGRVGTITTATQVPSDSMKCLKDEFEQWTFSPAVVNGRAVRASLDMLLRVQPPNANWHVVDPAEVPDTLVVVDVFPEPELPNKWRVWYGDRPASRLAIMLE